MTSDDANPPTDGQPTPDPHHRDFTHVYGTRVRTTTAAMLVAFVGLLVLFGYTTDYYAQIDADNAQNVRRPVVTQNLPETEETTESTTSSESSSTSSSTRPTGETTTGDEGSGESSTETPGSSSNPQVPLPTWLIPQQQQTTQSQVPQR